MKKPHHAKPESFITSPVYPGGTKALNEFIRSELKYPEAALENKIEGTVAVEHDIDVNGNVTDARIKHSIGYGCDEEAIRLVKMMKYEKKKYRGLRVVFHNTTNIHFRLHTASKPPENGPVLNYIVKAKPSETEKTVYNITYKF